MPSTLEHCARSALACALVDPKLDAIGTIAYGLAAGEITIEPDFPVEVAAVPGRPERPPLVHPRELTRRSAAAGEGHTALIHAMAHIEFNAINLALDAVCRFPRLPIEYYRDWFSVAVEEALHFRMLRDHLRSFDRDYGDFPAHDGLWQMAVKTAHDPLARMALVPRVLEARGLDASPGIIRRLRENGDRHGAEIVEVILADEVGHVAIGTRWFNHLCNERALDPETTFVRLLHEFDAPRPVLPLNDNARKQANFTPRELAHMHTLAQSRSPHLRK
jgi:uncharacterized ferritin-like protein (DUF455 family)